MDLKLVHENLRDAVEEQLLFVAAAESIDDLAGPLEQLTGLFEGLGLCHLLEDLDLEEYRINLTRAAYARRYYLRKCAAAGLSNRRLALSRTDAVLDALAIRGASLAREIANLSRADWNPDWEYRDDYCYFSLIHQFSGGEPTKPAAELLEDFETALEGQSSPRWELCRALAAGEAAPFAEAWTELMEETRERNDDARARMVEPDLPTFLYWPRSFVSVEGLALLYLAESRRLTPEPTHPLCPSAARRIGPGALVADLFEEIEAARQ